MPRGSSGSSGNRGPSDAGRLIQALSSRTAQTLSGTLDQQLRAAQEGLGSWTQNFAEQMNRAQTSMNSFKTTSDAMFGGLATGMTRTIANATLYSKSIGDAVDKALRSTLTAITGEAVVRALYNTGLGFYFLAIQAYDQAAQAFEAAAIFGSIAGVAGALAGAVPGGSAGLATGARGATTGGPAGGSTGTGSYGAPAGGNLTVLVMGEPQAATWLTQVINTGVENFDLKLVASHTKRSAPAGR